MILGTQWLKEFGPLTLDLNNLTLSIVKEGQTVTLQGRNKETGELQVINGAALYKLCAHNECTFVGQLQFVQQESGEKEQLNPAIATLLQEFSSVFVEPKGLPPVR